MTLKAKNRKKQKPTLYCIQWSSKKKPAQFHKGQPLYKQIDKTGEKIPLTAIEATFVAANADRYFTQAKHSAIRYNAPKTVPLFPTPSLVQ